MPKAYWITRAEVSDAESYKKYAENTAAAMQKYGGRFLARGGKMETMEGSGMSRNVVIEFKDFATAKACYESPEYQAARQHRLGKADFNLVIVEGVE